MRLEVGALTDVGRMREHNEDYLGMYRPSEAAARRRKGELFLVADGIGGHEAGEVASKLAVEQIIQAYAASPGQDSVAELVGAVEAANAAIYTLGQGQDRRWRMGTTLVGALVREHDLCVVNVGDSRAYLVRGERAEQISQDHSLVAEQVRMGLLDAEQARAQDYRSAITRALGSKPAVQVDAFTRALQHDDVIVLCSDGLSGLVQDQEIARLAASQPPQQAAAALVELANARGGRDNITAIVVKAREEGGRSNAPAARRRDRRILFWLALVLAGVGAVLVGLLALVPLTLGWGTDLPRQAPVIAPLEFPGEQVYGQRGEFARMLGYQDENDLLFKLGLSADQPWPPLEPAVVYVLLAGRIVRVEAEQPCRFALDMGGQPYYVVQCPADAPALRLRQGDQVSVLGVLSQASTRLVEPVTLDVNRIKWLGLDSDWTNGYTRLPPGKPVLVYTVVSSFTALKIGERDLIRDDGFRSGDPLLVYGAWDVVTVQDDQYTALTMLERAFRLDRVDEVYRQTP